MTADNDMPSWEERLAESLQDAVDELEHLYAPQGIVSRLERTLSDYRASKQPDQEAATPKRGED